MLEVGGGHDPYVGVTHAVDKYPQDNFQRAGNLRVSEGVEFREGDLEAIPFGAETKFDFLYVSHVFEHVKDPQKAIQEINRVALGGYLETPSPFREQLACPVPFDEALDFHTLFCWVNGRKASTLHVIIKSAGRVGEFCDCPAGRQAKGLVEVHRRSAQSLEPILPGVAKTTRLYFHTPLNLVIHEDFMSACRSGNCAYGAMAELRKWASFPFRLASRRFKKLNELLGEPKPIL